MDAYTILGVKSTDKIETIKSAYKKLANKHHPDKGGDADKFKQISQAYDAIKSGKVSNFTNKGYNFKTGTDIYNFFQKQSRNVAQTVTVTANISIQNAVNGGMQVLEIALVPGHKSQYINVEIPAGMEDGSRILYAKAVANKIDVMVIFKIVPDKVWSKNGLNLTKIEDFNFWELITGTTKEILTIDKEKIRLTIPAMTEPGTRFKLAKKGIRSRQNYLLKGDMYVKINAKLPINIPEEVLELISCIENK